MFSVYAVSMLFVEESKSFTIEKEINYPIDKVFPQFNNLQNFTQWNEFFVSKEDYTFAYYTPYEGQGSSLNYQNKKMNLIMEIFSFVMKILFPRLNTNCSKGKTLIHTVLM